MSIKEKNFLFQRNFTKLSIPKANVRRCLTDVHVKVKQTQILLCPLHQPGKYLSFWINLHFALLGIFSLENDFNELERKLEINFNLGGNYQIGM